MMKLLILTLLLIELVCLSLDPARAVFRPISMYQTLHYLYLGNVFVALLAVASILVLRKQFQQTEARFESGDFGTVERGMPLLLSNFALTCLLVMLLLVPIQYGMLHVSLAVGAMLGYSISLYWMAHRFADPSCKGRQSPCADCA